MYYVSGGALNRTHYRFSAVFEHSYVPLCRQIATNPSPEAKRHLVAVSKHVASAVAELVQSIDAIRGDFVLSLSVTLCIIATSAVQDAVLCSSTSVMSAESCDYLAEDCGSFCFDCSLYGSEYVKGFSVSLTAHSN